MLESASVFVTLQILSSPPVWDAILFLILDRLMTFFPGFEENWLIVEFEVLNFFWISAWGRLRRTTWFFFAVIIASLLTSSPFRISIVSSSLSEGIFESFEVRPDLVPLRSKIFFSWDASWYFETVSVIKREPSLVFTSEVFLPLELDLRPTLPRFLGEEITLMTLESVLKLLITYSVKIPQICILVNSFQIQSFDWLWAFRVCFLGVLWTRLLEKRIDLMA